MLFDYIIFFLGWFRSYGRTEAECSMFDIYWFKKNFFLVSADDMMRWTAYCKSNIYRYSYTVYILCNTAIAIPKKTTVILNGFLFLVIIFILWKDDDRRLQIRAPTVSFFFSAFASVWCAYQNQSFFPRSQPIIHHWSPHPPFASHPSETGKTSQRYGESWFNYKIFVWSHFESTPMVCGV